MKKKKMHKEKNEKKVENMEKGRKNGLNKER